MSDAFNFKKQNKKSSNIQNLLLFYTYENISKIVMLSISIQRDATSTTCDLGSEYQWIVTFQKE